MRSNSREIVLDTLLEIERRNEYSSGLLKDVMDKYNYLNINEKAFIKRVTEGTIERKLELDYLLNRFSSVPVKKMKPPIRCLLRMGVYQILYMNRIPDSAAINEAVKLAGKRSFQNLKGFVNGILRSIARQKAVLPYPDREKEPMLYLTVKYSMPEWIVEMWQHAYGREIAERLLEELLRIHPVSIRFRLGLDQKEIQDYIRKMGEKGVQVKPLSWEASLPGETSHPYVCRLTHMESVAALPGYADGAFTVQDMSSILSVEAAGIKTDDIVMDICAAPGGKSILACEKGGRVLARDISDYKLMRIEENKARLRAERVETQQWDATVFDSDKKETADILLVDVPCSGLGVIGKKNDIKYNITKEKLEDLVSLQKEIIRNSWQYVKPGGVLIYSTCTIHEKENEAMYRWILREFPFAPESLEEYLPREIWEQSRRLRTLCPAVELSDKEQAGCIQLLPGYMETDGFFIARMRRIEV